MRRVMGVLVLAAVLGAILALPAHAQGRDPFRPPAGNTQGTGAEPAPAVPGEELTPPASGRLPRTGLDVLAPFEISLILIAFGAALRLTGRAFEI